MHCPISEQKYGKVQFARSRFPMAKPNLKLVPPATKKWDCSKTAAPAPAKERRSSGTGAPAARGGRAGDRGGAGQPARHLRRPHGAPGVPACRRASEVTDLKWEQVDFDRAEIHVNRLKGGTPASHPLTGREMRELRKHRRDSPPAP